MATCGATRRLAPFLLGKAPVPVVFHRKGGRQAEHTVMVLLPVAGYEYKRLLSVNGTKAGGIRCHDAGDARCSVELSCQCMGFGRVSAERSGRAPKHPLEFLLSNPAGEHPN